MSKIKTVETSYASHNEPTTNGLKHEAVEEDKRKIIVEIAFLHLLPSFVDNTELGFLGMKIDSTVKCHCGLLLGVFLNAIQLSHPTEVALNNYHSVMPARN